MICAFIVGEDVVALLHGFPRALVASIVARLCPPSVEAVSFSMHLLQPLQLLEISLSEIVKYPLLPDRPFDGACQVMLGCFVSGRKHEYLGHH